MILSGSIFRTVFFPLFDIMLRPVRRWSVSTMSSSSEFLRIDEHNGCITAVLTHRRCGSELRMTIFAEQGKLHMYGYTTITRDN